MRIVALTNNKSFEKSLKSSLPSQNKVEKVFKKISDIKIANDLYNPDIIILDMNLLYEYANEVKLISETIRAKLVVISDLFLEKSFMNENKRIVNLVSKSVEHEISKELLEIDVKPKLKGYQYIKDGVLHLKQNDYSMNEIYFLLAKEYDKNPKSIERAIRTCVKNAKVCDTNKELIYYINKKVK